MSTTALTAGVNRLRRVLGSAVAWGPHHPATAGPVPRPQMERQPDRQPPKLPVPGTGRGVRR